MSDCNRSAFLNLFPEQRHYASVASQDVSKTYCYIFRIGVLIESLDDHFADSFGRTHNIGRSYGFVRRNQHHTFCAYGTRFFCHVNGSKYIILNGVAWAVFHQRHMFMGCRMEYNFRTVFCENIMNSLTVLYRNDENHHIQLRIVTL